MSGKKRIENRAQKFPLGKYGLHVSKSVPSETGLPIGHVVATIIVSEVISADEAMEKYPEQAEYISGPWCGVIANVASLEEPFPARGNCGVFYAEIPERTFAADIE